MSEPLNKKIPRHGYITELARICNCSRKTVSRALFDGHTGPKAELVLSTYQKLFNPECTEK